jgi:elongation factor 4
VQRQDGQGVREILEAICRRVPPPKYNTAENAPLRALMFDSWYDTYRGAMGMVRVFDGTLRKGEKIKMMATGAVYEATELGVYSPFPVLVDHLGPGEVGYFGASIKTIRDTKVGDTITQLYNAATEPLAGFKEVKPMVFCGVFPTDSEQYPELRDALDKLHLNDSAFQFEPENSDALGFGFRCGFLGLLHMEIVQERLEREYNLDLITTAPSVVYRVTNEKGETYDVENPSRLPDGRGRSRSRTSRSPSTCPTPTWARSSSCARTAAASRRGSSTPRPSASSSPTSCPSERCSSTSSTSSRTPRAATPPWTTSWPGTARTSWCASTC